MFFFLAQTEQGDIFKITLDTDEDMVSPEWFQVLKKYNDDLSEAHDLFTHTKKTSIHMFRLHKSEDIHAMFTHTHTKTHGFFFTQK